MKQSMKMEPKKNNVIASLLGGVAISGLFLLSACGDDGSKTAGGTEEDAGIIAITDKMVSGVSQKGPFANGSSVTVYELDGKTLAQTGSSFEGKIKNDLGEFSVKVVSLASQYALLKANGFYRNEITGEKSNSQITLYALTDLSDRDEVNVNLLTHLAYERSLFLATEDSLLVAKAKKQAEAEVFQSFGIEGVADAAEDLNIFGESDQSAALLAVSILMQGNLKEADFSERLNDYAQDIEADGVWDDAVTATQVADWAAEQGLGAGLVSIRGNVQAWNSLAGVPDFEKYVNNFWYQNYGLGTCDKKREGEVKKNQNAASVRANEYFICKSGTWVVASDLEKDTYKWEAGKDADVKNGDVVATNCYVFEDKAWRSGNESDCSLNLRGCTKLRQDTVGQGADKAWYICSNRHWRNSTDIEKDTATWGAGKFDGEVRVGQVNKNIHYIYKSDKKAWRVATVLEYDTYSTKCSKNGSFFEGNVIKDNKYVCDADTFRTVEESEILAELGCTSYTRGEFRILKGQYSYYKCETNGWEFTTEKLNKGTMVDSRDNREYKTIGIKSQIWMAENLNYADSLNYPSMLKRNWCMDDVDNCAKFGRYYSWTAIIDSVSLAQNGIVCSEDTELCFLGSDVIQGICPVGWHLPTPEEWETLFVAMNNDYRAMQAKGFEQWKDATDEYGFSVLPAGSYYVDEGDEIADIHKVGEYARFWSVPSSSGTYGGEWVLNKNETGLEQTRFKYGQNSVRCVKDAE